MNIDKLDTGIYEISFDTFLNIDSGSKYSHADIVQCIKNILTEEQKNKLITFINNNDSDTLLVFSYTGTFMHHSDEITNDVFYKLWHNNGSDKQ